MNYNDCTKITSKLRHIYGLYEVTKIFSQIMPVIPSIKELEKEISYLEKIALENNIDYPEIKKNILDNDEWLNSAVKSVLLGSGI